MEAEKGQLLAEITAVTQRGDNLLQAAEASRDPVTHARVSNKLQEIKVSILRTRSGHAKRID